MHVVADTRGGGRGGGGGGGGGVAMVSAETPSENTEYMRPKFIYDSYGQ